MRQTEVREPGAVVLAVREDHVARENLIRGASQIKLALRVGVSSNFDPVDVTKSWPRKRVLGDKVTSGASQSATTGWREPMSFCLSSHPLVFMGPDPSRGLINAQILTKQYPSTVIRQPPCNFSRLTIVSPGKSDSQ